MKKNNKKLSFIVLIFCLATLASIVLFLKYNKDSFQEEITLQGVSEKTEKENNIQQSIQNEPKVVIKKANLFSYTYINSIPLSAIYELSSFSENIQNIFVEIVESCNVYFIKKIDNKLIALVENPDDIRHGLEFVEIDLNTENLLRFPLEINQEDSENDIWIFDEKSNSDKPIKHTKLKNNGLISYTEKWYYDKENPIKYKKDNGEEKTISIKKETYDNNSNMRLEHLFYDDDGNTKNSVSIAFVGSNLVRFTYYNSENQDLSLSIFSEYSEGKKTKETVYTSDYKVNKIYKANYTDDIRTSITVFDSNNNKIDEILSK